MVVVTVLKSIPELSLLEELVKYIFDDRMMLPQATAIRRVSFCDHGYHFSRSERLSNFILGVIGTLSIQFVFVAFRHWVD